MQKTMEAGEEACKRQIEEKEEWMYRKLAYEIDRTKALEAILERVRVKYWNRIDDLENQNEAKRLEYASLRDEMETQCQAKIQAVNQGITISMAQAERDASRDEED